MPPMIERCVLLGVAKGNSHAGLEGCPCVEGGDGVIHAPPSGRCERSSRVHRRLRITSPVSTVFAMRIVFAGIVLCTLAAACTGPDREVAGEDSLTTRERDSILAGSRVPGAAGVRGAITGSDSAARRAARLDSLSRVP